MKKFISLVILFFLFSLLLSHFSFVISAQILNKDYNRTFTTTQEFVQISETKNFTISNPNYFIAQGSTESFTIFFPIQNDPFQEEKKQQTLDSISISDSRGRDLDYTILEENPNSLVIGISLPEQISFNNPYSITLQYNAYGLLVKTGAIIDVYVPAFSESYLFSTDQYTESITTTVVIPDSLGEVNFVTTEHVRSDTDSSTEISINAQDLIGTPAWIQIGTQQFYSFDLTQPYQKTSVAPFFLNTISLPIPRDIQSGPITQTVFYEQIQPSPSRIYEDENQNLIAEFKIPSNSTGEIHVSGFISLSQNPNYPVDTWGTKSDIPQSIINQSTNPGEFWEVNNEEIQAVANELSQSENLYDQILNTYNYVIDKIDYSTVKRFGINERQGALKTLQGGAAVCMEYSDLFITLMRAQGIPARAAFGYGYSTLDYDSQEDTTVNHQWAEVYVPGEDTWIAVDTTWGDGGPELIGGDLNHVYFHVATKDPNTPSSTSIEYLGNLEAIQERSTNVLAIENIPTGSYLDSNDLLQTYQTYSNTNYIQDSISSSAKTIGNSFTDFLPVSFSSEVRNTIGYFSLIFLIIMIIAVIHLFVNAIIHLIKHFLYTIKNGYKEKTNKKTKKNV